VASPPVSLRRRHGRKHRAGAGRGTVSQHAGDLENGHGRQLCNAPTPSCVSCARARYRRGVPPRLAGLFGSQRRCSPMTTTVIIHGRRSKNRSCPIYTAHTHLPDLIHLARHAAGTPVSRPRKHRLQRLGDHRIDPRVVTSAAARIARLGNSSKRSGSTSTSTTPTQSRLCGPSPPQTSSPASRGFVCESLTHDTSSLSALNKNSARNSGAV
jgi:hypothetical protein